MLFASMLALGALIGFVGAGGAGVTITLLTVGFHVPIHTALAVALASMVFTMLSGTISHFRQHEVLVKTGAIMGCGGILGAYLGANFSNMLPSNILSAVTGLLLASSAVTLYIKMYQGAWLERHFPVRKELLTGRKLWIYGLSSVSSWASCPVLSASVQQLTFSWLSWSSLACRCCRPSAPA